MAKSGTVARSAAAYDDAARVAQYDAKMNLMHPNRTKMAEIVCAMLPFETHAAVRVLDLGTGTGFLSAQVLQTFPRAQVIAVDGAAAMMQQARARLREKAQALTWKICTFLEDIAASLAKLEQEDGDQPLALASDLQLLREAGFHEVDCFWKETREAVWGGVQLHG